MRFWIFGTKRQAAALIEPVASGSEARPELSALRVTSGQRVPARTIGRRERDYTFGRIFIPSALLDATLLLLRQSGVHGDERFLVWAGTVAAGEAFASTVVMPRATSGPLHGEIPADVAGRVFEALDSRDLVPLAQLHTHPRGAGMSPIDRERPLVAVRGFLSIIVPDFAFVDPDNFEPWGVYEYESPRRWRELLGHEKLERLIVDDSILRID